MKTPIITLSILSAIAMSTAAFADTYPLNFSIKNNSTSSFRIEATTNGVEADYPDMGVSLNTNSLESFVPNPSQAPQTIVLVQTNPDGSPVANQSETLTTQMLTGGCSGESRLQLTINSWNSTTHTADLSKECVPYYHTQHEDPRLKQPDPKTITKLANGVVYDQKINLSDVTAIGTPAFGTAPYTADSCGVDTKHSPRFASQIHCTVIKDGSGKGVGFEISSINNTPVNALSLDIVEQVGIEMKDANNRITSEYITLPVADTPQPPVVKAPYTPTVKLTNNVVYNTSININELFAKVDNNTWTNVTCSLGSQLSPNLSNYVSCHVSPDMQTITLTGIKPVDEKDLFRYINQITVTASQSNGLAISPPAPQTIKLPTTSASLNTSVPQPVQDQTAVVVNCNQQPVTVSGPNPDTSSETNTNKVNLLAQSSTNSLNIGVITQAANTWNNQIYGVTTSLDGYQTANKIPAGAYTFVVGKKLILAPIQVPGTSSFSLAQMVQFCKVLSQ